MTRIVVGVDGGGSRTRVIVADEHGAELARADGEPSAIRPGEQADTLRAEADAALYEAKRQGGNRSSHFDDIRERVVVTTSAKKEAVRALIDEAAAWGKANEVPLLCNEFGVFREHSDPVSRNAWIRDVRTALEADGIGWAMWDYRGGFGVVTKENGKAAEPDPATVSALGLKTIAREN